MINHIIGKNYFILKGANQTIKCLVGLIGRRSAGSNSAAYDGDGKTTVRVLNHEEPHLNLINTYSAHGFRLANNLFINGSILLFPIHVYSWNVKRGIDINMESLIVFDLIVPKTKIVIIGYGQNDEPYDPTIPLKLKKKGISCEMLPTPHAVTTYNYLVHDSVHVAGAFVPVKDELTFQKKHNRALSEHDYLFNEKEYLPLSEIERDSFEFYEERVKEFRKDNDKNKKTFDE